MRNAKQPTVSATVRRAEQVPSKFKRLHRDVVVERRGTRSQAIKAMCLECMGWYMKEVAACTSVACPLHRFRPFQRTESHSADATPPESGASPPSEQRDNATEASGSTEGD